MGFFKNVLQAGKGLPFLDSLDLCLLALSAF